MLATVHGYLIDAVSNMRGAAGGKVDIIPAVSGEAQGFRARRRIRPRGPHRELRYWIEGDFLR